MQLISVSKMIMSYVKIILSGMLLYKPKRSSSRIVLPLKFYYVINARHIPKITRPVSRESNFGLTLVTVLKIKIFIKSMFLNPLGYYHKKGRPIEKRFSIYGFMLESDFYFQIIRC
jgi:hypothetical protein